MKLCGHCHEREQAPNHRWCRECKAADARARRARVLRVPRGALETMTIKQLLALPNRIEIV